MESSDRLENKIIIIKVKVLSGKWFAIKYAFVVNGLNM